MCLGQKTTGFNSIQQHSIPLTKLGKPDALQHLGFITTVSYDKIGMVLHLLAQRRLLSVVYCYSIQLYDYTIAPSETQFYNFHQSLHNHGPVWERMLCVICSQYRLLAVISPQAVSMYSPFQRTWVMTNIYSYIVGLCHTF